MDRPPEGYRARSAQAQVGVEDGGAGLQHHHQGEQGQLGRLGLIGQHLPHLLGCNARVTGIAVFR